MVVDKTQMRTTCTRPSKSPRRARTDLAAKIPVEHIRVGQGLEGDGGDDRSVPVEHVADVDGVRCLLHGQGALALGEDLKVASVLTPRGHGLSCVHVYMHMMHLHNTHACMNVSVCKADIYWQRSLAGVRKVDLVKPDEVQYRVQAYAVLVQSKHTHTRTHARTHARTNTHEHTQSGIFEIFGKCFVNQLAHGLHENRQGWYKRRIRRKC